MRPTEEISEEDKTVYCGNLSEEVTDEVLYELFSQAGPIERLSRPRDQSGRPKPFAFIVFKHDCSVPYSLELFLGTKLFNRNIKLNSRSILRHVPVLNTHITEFNEPRSYTQNSWGNEFDSYRNQESNLQPRKEDNINENDVREYRRNENYRREGHRNDSQGRDDRRRREGYRNDSQGRDDRHRRDNYRNESHRRDGHRRDDDKHCSSSRKHVENDSNEPTSWAEYNALRGKGSIANEYRPDLQGYQGYLRDSTSGGQQQAMVDFDALLQMGQEMMIHQPVGGLMQMGLGPSLGSNMFPSMQGGMSGGHHNPESSRREQHNYNDRRDSRRDRPYDNRARNAARDDHRRHDRGYSSSRSSHEREKRDRRSR